MALGSLSIDLSANTARLQSDLGKADRMFQKSAQGIEKQAISMGKALGGIAAGLATGAFASWIKGSIDAADEASKAAAKIGRASCRERVFITV